MAKALGICEGLVLMIVKTQPGLLPYKLTKAQLPLEEMKAKRLQKTRKMLRIGGHRRVLFTDEKIFTVKRRHNNQNDWQLLQNGSLKSFVTISISIGLFTEPEIVFRSHFPASVTV